MTDTTVRYYDSTMTGAPNTVNNTAGGLLSVLNACLDTGFNSVTLTSLAVSSHVATATKANHGFAALTDGTIRVYPVIRISGATPAELNGDWRLASIPDADTFTFATPGISDQTASGTITAKRAPLWSTATTSCVAHTGTNKAAYRRVDPLATAMVLRVDDTTTTYARVKGYEAMTDVNTGSGAWPSAARYLYKAANSTPVGWAVIGDARAVYVWTNSDDSWAESLFFGDALSYKAGDAYHALLIAATASSSYGGNIRLLGSADGADWCRNLAQVATVGAARYSHGKSGNYLGYEGNAWPAAADSGFHAWPVEVWDDTTAARGLMPGLWNPLHTGQPPHGTLIDAIPQLPGRVLQVRQDYGANFRLALDLIGPWR